MSELITAVDDSTFKKAMSNFLSGVTVVTTELDGQWYGMTVASFASLSLNPPLVLICVEKNVKAHDVIPKAERFGVSFLGDHQADISNRFASRVEDRFAGVDVRTGVLKLPLLASSIASIECRLFQTLPGGDHTIFVGEVVAAYFSEGQPLAYFRSGYHKLAR